MIYDAQSMENAAILQCAQRMMAAARTAPKTHATDRIHTLLLTDEDKNHLADEMDALAEPFNYAFFHRDADNVRAAQAVVLIGTTEGQRGLNEGCGYCHFQNCADCKAHGACCVYDAMDLGISLGSAVSLAADARVDSRILFSAGRAARTLRFFPDEVSIILAVPLSVSGKSPFFDRKPKK